MAKAQRLDRLDALRVSLEAEYQSAFIEALRRAAAGSWGLFDHNSDRWTRANWQPTVTNLYDLGEEIDLKREALGLSPFAMHQEFLASRGPVSSNAPGEPKQAKAWLERLGESL